MIGRLLAHYEITGLLGKGGMGEVYSARDRKLGRQVALKLVPSGLAADPTRLQRFQLEARTVAGLNHPNIVTLYSVEESEGIPFLTMELVKGRNLQQVLTSGKRPVAEALELGVAVAEALSAAHAQGVVHRDLKPANIMLDQGGRVKVLDFGMARLTDAAASEDGPTLDAPLTAAGSILGTAPYMSPEQARGEKADHRSDIWALGVILYEMLAGKNPFKAENIPASLYLVNNVDPEALSRSNAEISPDLDALVSRALAKDCGQRYQSAVDLAGDLKTLQRAFMIQDTVALAPTGQAVHRLPQLAVLPFAGLKPDPETDFLGFALADQVIGSLAYIKSLRIKPASAVRKYQGLSVDQTTAATDLKVDYLLSGYYLKEGGTVRLNLELIKTGTEELVWREAIQVRYENVFELQDIVSQRVVEGLEVQFPQEARERAVAYIPSNPAAYEYYLRSLSYPHTNAGDKLAIGMLRNSIQLDGNFASAHAELGNRLSTYGLLALQGPDILPEVEACFQAALAIDRDHLPALGGLASLLAETGKIYEALELSERMLAINPNHAQSHFKHHAVLRIGGLLDESWTFGRKALALDPGNPNFRNLGFNRFYARRYEEAIEAFNLDKDSFHTIAWVGFAKYLNGEKDEGWELMEAGAAHEPDGHLGHHFGALMAGWRGDYGRGIALAHHWEAPGHYDAEWYYNLANTYALLRDVEGCVRTLKRAVEGGFLCYDYLAHDPLTESMRRQPAVAALIEQARIKHLAFKEFYLKNRG